jgi:hypothetical protein
MAIIPKGSGQSANTPTPINKGRRMGDYDGIPADRPATSMTRDGYVHSEKEYFGQENAGGIHDGLSADTVIGARKGNRAAQHPAPTYIKAPMPFSKLTGGR